MLIGISRMKSLVSPASSLLCSSHLAISCKPSSSPLYFQPSRRQISSLLLPFRRSPLSSYIHMSSLRLNCVRRDAFSSSCSRSPPTGEIHVIVGPMFAGKTSALLRRIQSENSNGRNVALIKSSKDTRYDLHSVVTHDGDKYPCMALGDLSSFRQRFGPCAYDKLDVIGIDEAQFFEDLYDFCQKAADLDGKTIIVAGLDGDYMRKSFGHVLDIIPLADSVTKLTARCELCGKCAYFTLRKTEETETELIGGAEVYMPVCRQHYVSGQVVIEAARKVLQQKVLNYSAHVRVFLHLPIFYDPRMLILESSIS